MCEEEEEEEESGEKEEEEEEASCGNHVKAENAWSANILRTG